jgi:hypothetical protein
MQRIDSYKGVWRQRQTKHDAIVHYAWQNAVIYGGMHGCAALSALSPKIDQIMYRPTGVCARIQSAAQP